MTRRGTRCAAGGGAPAGRWPALVFLVAGLLLASVFPFVSLSTTARGAPSGHPLVPTASAHPGAPSSQASHPSPASRFSAKSDAWSELSSAVAGARTGAAFASLPARGLGVLFGGRNGTGLLSDTELYNQTTNQWVPLAPIGHPGPRSDFGFAGDNATNTAILFGGLRDVNLQTVSNLTWKFSFATGNWTQLATSVAPAGREDPAFTIGNGSAMLYGGRDPYYHGLGELVFNDTWVLNLSTDVWREIPTPPPAQPAPGPLYGASMVWDSNQSRFLLFGGCYPCTSAVWSFNTSSGGGAGAWEPVAARGSAPGARMDAAFLWDSAQQAALLFGGTAGGVPYGDTYVFDPGTATWVGQASVQSPSARAGAAAAFLNLPGNETVLLAGGITSSGQFPVGTWRLAPTSSLNLLVIDASQHFLVMGAYARVGTGPVLETGNGPLHVPDVVSNETTINASAPGYFPLNTTLWIPPSVSWTLWLNLTPAPTATANVTVTDPAGAPLGGASVTVSIQGNPVAGSPRVTDAAGRALFPGVPAFGGAVAAMRAGFHNTTVGAVFPPGALVYVNVTLTPLVVLAAHVEGLLPDGKSLALGGVSVVVHGYVLGQTAANGWLNASTGLFGAAEVVASEFGFQPGRLNVTLPYTGIAYANLTLVGLPYPSITVQVLEAGVGGGGFPIENAEVNVTSVGSPPTGLYLARLRTGPLGAVAVSPPAGNYTVTAWALGFFPNSYPGTLFAPPFAQVGVTIDLTPLPLSSMDVQVVTSEAGHGAIPGANVTLTFLSVNVTTGGVHEVNDSAVTPSDGWANFTNLPGTTIVVTGSAFGFYTNISTTQVEYGQQLPRYLLHLTPIPRAHVGGPAPGEALSILPPGAVSVWALLLLPILALVGALVYLTTLRTPPRRETPPPPPALPAIESGPAGEPPS